jgi:serine protease
MAGVEGGPAEELRLDVHQPLAANAGGVPLIEFHHDATDRYYLAPGAERAAQVDAGAAGPGWARSGLVIKAYSLAKPPRPYGRTATLAAPACAFRFVNAAGPESWFYTTKPAECEAVKGQPGWRYEGTAFHAARVDAAGRCPPGQLVVQRAYNNGAARGELNHRFTTSDSTLREMVRRGWVDEGPAMCALP